LNLEFETSPEISIRAAVPADIDKLTALPRALFAIEKDFTFDEETQRRGLQMMLRHDRGCILVAESEGRLIGMCSGQLTISIAEGGPSLLIEDVVIQRDRQGKGAGRRLMAVFGEWAGQHDVSRSSFWRIALEQPQGVQTQYGIPGHGLSLTQPNSNYENKINTPFPISCSNSPRSSPRPF
jgi:GNAT superfamily N-acetyltransferase